MAHTIETHLSNAPALERRLSAVEQHMLSICQEAAAVSQSMADLCWQIDHTTIISMADLYQYIQQIHQWDDQLLDLGEALSAGRLSLLEADTPLSEQLITALDAEIAGLQQESDHLTQVLGEVIACYEAPPDEWIMKQ